MNVPLDTTTTHTNPLFAAITGRSLAIAQMIIAAGIDTKAAYALGSSPEIVDAVVFAMLQGTRDIARAIALHNERGDVRAAEKALADALAIAQSITSPSAG